MLKNDQRISYLDERVVQKKHHSRKPKRPAVIVKNHLPQITNITNLRMAHAKLPDTQLAHALPMFTEIAYQQINEVYSTIAATTHVKMSPGTSPRIEYDHGKDMMARQMYSENSSAAV